MEKITIETIVNVPIEKAWHCWNEPTCITQWAFASDDWEAPSAENDIRTGGKFLTRMQAKDGSAGFDFGGVYSNVVPNEIIEYSMDDKRAVSVRFESMGENATKITETFDPETENPIEMQRAGWQAILNNYTKHTETHHG